VEGSVSAQEWRCWSLGLSRFGYWVHSSQMIGRQHRNGQREQRRLSSGLQALSAKPGMPARRHSVARLVDLYFSFGVGCRPLSIASLRSCRSLRRRLCGQARRGQESSTQVSYQTSSGKSSTLREPASGLSSLSKWPLVSHALTRTQSEVPGRLAFSSCIRPASCRRSTSTGFQTRGIPDSRPALSLATSRGIGGVNGPALGRQR
jgi:hypothetical protein